MHIIIDKRLPKDAKDKLAVYGDLIELTTSNITYDAISGHPDIFFCKTCYGLVVSPNLPEKYKSFLYERDISHFIGKNNINCDYPESAAFNAVVTDSCIFHRLDITDPSIISISGHLQKVNVSQGYTRCNLLPLRNDSYITSDKGIFKTLTEHSIKTLYVNPEGIILPGFSHGFFGGACGVCEDRVFIAGSLDLFQYGKAVREFLDGCNYKIVELYKGPLFDGGSILFVE